MWPEKKIQFQHANFPEINPWHVEGAGSVPTIALQPWADNNSPE
jgi:hypothetical protein